MTNSIFVPIFLVIAGILLFLLLLVFLLGIKMETVSQEKRLVIYRRGMFNRFAGPGWVFWSRYFETIEREIFVREENKKLNISGLFINGVPFGYSLELWMRYDPSRTLEKGDPRLAELAQFDDRERNEQVKSALRDGLIASLAQVELDFPPVKGNPFFFKLLPILPGRPEFVKLLEYLQAELTRRLPDVGALSNANRPITILGINLDPQTLAGFNQARSITLLKEAMPDLPDEQLLNMVGKINGINVGYMRMELEGNASAELRYRDPESGVELKIKPPNQKVSATSENFASEQAQAGEPPPANSATESTSNGSKSTHEPTESPTPVILQPVKSDWQVLKRLAR